MSDFTLKRIRCTLIIIIGALAFGFWQHNYNAGLFMYMVLNLFDELVYIGQLKF